MSGKTQRWLLALLINVALAQASIYVMRPMITYRALENGASGYEIGLIASIYALVPLLIAVPMGRWVGRIGEIPLLVAGCLSFIVLGVAFSFLNNIVAIAAATALSGVAHLSNVAASQAMVASRSALNLQDQNFDSEFDRVVLDMLAPWECVDIAARALRPGGVFLAYVATTTQLSATAEALKEDGRFTEPESSETMVRGWHHEGLAVRPQQRMIGHTGFLIQSRRMAPGVEVLARRRRPAKGAYGVSED